jgi:hypothetical protein
MRTHIALSSAVLLSLTLGLAGVGHAETTQCTVIATLPTTITQPGIYCLTADFTLNMATDVAIRINVANVVVDLNGHTIDNAKAGAATSATGIYGSGIRNVVVKNGVLRGFAYGVFVNDVSPFTKSYGWIIEDVRTDRTTHVGLLIWGRDGIVRRNQVVTTGGSTLTPDATGIILVGPRHRAIDNDVITVTAPGTSVGIAFGVDSDNGVAIGNRITATQYGIHFMEASTKYRDNLTTLVTLPYTGGTDAGNNN